LKPVGTLPAKKRPPNLSSFARPKGVSRFSRFNLFWCGRCVPDHQVNGWLWRIGSQEMGLRIGGNQELILGAQVADKD